MTREFPENLTYGELRATHPDYNPICPLTKIGILDKHDDLYKGGSPFRRHIEHYLVKRTIEGGDTPTTGNRPGINPKSEGSIMASTASALQGTGSGNAGRQQWEARKKRAFYEPFVAFICDFIAAAINQNPPLIVNPKQKSDDDPQMKYWHNLNDSVDGYGQDLNALAIQTIQEIAVHKRGYLYISFPKVNAGNLLEQQQAGGLDGRINLWGARFVDDWEINSEKQHVWVRTHATSNVRESVAGQPTLERHVWTYVTSNAIYTYTFQFKIGDSPTDETLVSGICEPHDLKKLPVIPLCVPDYLWVMDRLSDTQLALFNRQSAAGFTLDAMAFAMLVAKTQKNLSAIVADDICGVLLDPGDSLTFESPNPAIHAAQKEDIERLKGELFSIINMMSLQAEKDKGGNPASGSAKQMDMGGMTTLLGAFAAPERDAIEQAIDFIKEVRKETDLPLVLQGLDKFDVQSLEKKIANALQYLTIQNVPLSARQWVTMDTSLAMCNNAPAEVRNAIVTESQKIEEPEPVTQQNQIVPQKSVDNKPKGV